MSDAPQIPSISAIGPIAVDEALRIRSRIFWVITGLYLIFWGIGVAISLALDANSSRPDVLTWVVFGAMVIEIPVLSVFLFDPARMTKRLQEASIKSGRSPSLRDFARMSGGISAMLSASTLAWGFVLAMVSGQVWRGLIFFPVSFVAAMAYSTRVGGAIKLAAASGVR